ncbi:MAG: hypothetical protein ACW967_09290 [Candidatus Hodarchaeales archaeon]
MIDKTKLTLEEARSLSLEIQSVKNLFPLMVYGIYILAPILYLAIAYYPEYMTIIIVIAILPFTIWLWLRREILKPFFFPKRQV